jgi:hypothetical protein
MSLLLGSTDDPLTSIMRPCHGDRVCEPLVSSLVVVTGCSAKEAGVAARATVYRVVHRSYSHRSAGGIDEPFRGDWLRRLPVSPRRMQHVRHVAPRDLAAALGARCPPRATQSPRRRQTVASATRGVNLGQRPSESPKVHPDCVRAVSGLTSTSETVSHSTVTSSQSAVPATRSQSGEVVADQF